MARPESVDRLEQWLKTSQDESFALVCIILRREEVENLVEYIRNLERRA